MFLPHPDDTKPEPSIWNFVGEPPLITQGWKLYVSANNGTFDEVLRLTAPIFEARGIPYKYVNSERSLWRLNAGLEGYSQIGKSIVAYVGDAPDLADLIGDLKRVLDGYRSSAILPPYAAKLGGGLPIAYRYGSYFSDELQLGSVAVADDRFRLQTQAAELPADPFERFLEARPQDQGLDRLLLQYPVFEAISQSGKGGVFAALDLSAATFSEVILKIGRRHGNLMPDGRDGQSLTKREHWFYDLVCAESDLAKHVPKVLAFHEFADEAVLVMERLEGQNLLQLQIEEQLRRADVEQAVAILESFHRSGLLVGDAKLGNFIRLASGQLKVFDFETAGVIESRWTPDQHSTFMFVDRQLQSRPAAWELVHFLYSVIHKNETADFDERNRIIDLPALLETQPESEVARFALKRIREILSGQADPAN